MKRGPAETARDEARFFTAAGRRPAAVRGCAPWERVIRNSPGFGGVREPESEQLPVPWMLATGCATMSDDM